MVQDRRRRAFLLGLAMPALAFTPMPLGPAAASCAAPYLVVEGTQARPVLDKGTDITVDGRAFVRGCDDTGTVAVNAFGCESPERREPTAPMKDVRLRLQQGGRNWILGTEDAGLSEDNESGRVTWRVRIPAGVEAGRAVLVADVPPRGRDPLDARLDVMVGRP